MPMAIMLVLIQLGCAPQPFRTPGGEQFVVWVCPPVYDDGSKLPDTLPVPPTRRPT
jgi:hypothetical protein